MSMKSGGRPSNVSGSGPGCLAVDLGAGVGADEVAERVFDI